MHMQLTISSQVVKRLPSAHWVRQLSPLGVAVLLWVARRPGETQCLRRIDVLVGSSI